MNPEKSKFEKAKKQGRLPGIMENGKRHKTVADLMRQNNSSYGDLKKIYNSKRSKKK